MYLKKIEIHGFKSFAEKVNIDFFKGINGIVGPNGSGKSNIIDAVRWVLGEQSARTLRGGKMEDVIFNGTEHRKPLGFAEVTLTFDNSDNFLPIDYSEVTITRRIYRSGESEYLLNKTPCRLKDIKELLMDTGIGIDGYSLIGQGEIDRILSSRPEERKELFEEAAGIVKYKVRKEEAEKKLEITNQNLIRISDIIDELNARLEPLREESIKAKSFLELNNELRELELNLLLHDIDEIKSKLDLEVEQFKIVEEQIKNYTNEKDIVSKKYSNCYDKLNIINNELDNLQKSFQDTINHIKDLESKRVLYEEKITNTKKNFERIKNELEELEAKKDTNINEYNNLIAAKEELEAKINSLANKIDIESALLIEKANHIKEEENKIEVEKSELIEILNKISNYKSEINGLSVLKENIDRGIKKAEVEKNELIKKKDQKQFEKEIKEKKLSKLSNILKTLELKKSNLSEENESIKSIIEKKKEELEKAKNLLQEVITKQRLYEQMEKNYDGYNFSVKKTLELCNNNPDFGKGVHGVVAQLISLPKELEIPIEIALGASMQCIVCDDEIIAKKIINYLKIKDLGRVTFYPLNNINVKDSDKLPGFLKNFPGFIGRGDEVISYDTKYSKLFKYLLDKTLIVDNIDTATEIFKKIKTYKIVTLEGDVINPSGAITGGSIKFKSNNILCRRRIIEELKERANKLDEQIKELETKIIDINDRLIWNSRKLVKTNERINKYLVHLKDCENQNRNLEQEIIDINSSIEKFEKEINQLNRDFDDININILNKQEIIDRLYIDNNTNKERITKELENLSNEKKELESRKIQIENLKYELIALKEKKEHIIKEVLRLEKHNNEIKKNIEDRNNQLISLEIDISSFEDEIKNIDLNLKDNNIFIKQIEYNINKSISDKNEIQKNMDQLQNKIDEINSALQELKESLHKIDVRKTRLELQKDTICKSILEKYEISYEEALKEKKHIDDYNEASKKINSLKKKIKELGVVNLNSIKEFDEVNDRFTFLSTQRDDLIKGKNSLNKIIQNLENTMEKQFIETFNCIKENFAEIFKKLFDGGKAKLILENPDNPLSSNIEIIAQPPGKKLQNLNLLSGGEKALTAIALLFAILKTKPTPFCILDEIEAALDDANIYKFAEFLKEFSKESQFIIITHRKGTMEIIDYLYGVTMEEYGISKIISVKLTEEIG